MIGTGFLRRFLATVDYPGRRLVLRPPGSPTPSDVEVPFALAATHLLIARGSLNGLEPLAFIVDSGLQEEAGAAFTAPRRDPQGRRHPGAGDARGRAGVRRRPRHPLDRPLPGRPPRPRPGGAKRPDGALRPLPSGVANALGFPVNGLVSHGFLRRYAWTLDFERMAMTFAEPD